MRRKTGIIAVGLLATALAVAAFFIRKEKQVVVIDPWEAVPADAFLIAETSDFPELLTSITDPAGILSDLTAMEWAASLVRSAAAIDSVTGGREVRELISNRKMLISFHVAGQRRAVPLVVMSTGPAFTARRLTTLCSQAGAVVTDKRDLGGTRTFTVTFTRGARQTPVYIALTSGIMIITPAESLLTAALENRNAGSDIRHQQGFAPVVSAAGKEVDNVFLLFRNLPPFLRSFIDPEDIAAVSSVAIAGGGDLTTAEDGLFISGFLTTAGAGAGADRINDVAPAESGVNEILPGSTLSYSTVMRRASLAGETATDPASINATDLALILSPYTGTEVTNALIATGEGSGSIHLFRMTDRQSAEEVLRQRLTAKYRSMGLRESHFVASAKDAEGREEVIYRMPFNGVASILAGTDKSKAGDGWITFARSYMIFSDSPEALAYVLRESGSENTLINDPGFREMEKTMPSKSSFLFWSSGRVLGSLISEYLTPAAAASLNDGVLSGISGMGISLTPSNDMIYTSLSVRYSKDEVHPAGATGIPAATGTSANATTETASGDSSALRLIWRVKLDAEPAIKPFFFTNHNTGATEIFIQDKNNNIYLISPSGKILWKAAIREKITGDIFMIDYYRNGKLQMLFAGRDYLHLVDRNGNYVDKYPVKMRSQASNTLAVFDYENNKDYRLFIAGDDRRIYAYDRSGTPVRGWNPFTTRGRVTDPVSFFRVKGKDYLFVADDQAVYILDRTGNIRVAHHEPLAKAPGSTARLTAGSESAIIFSSPDGNTVRMMFDGTVERDTLKDVSKTARSEFADIDGDNTTDQLSLDRGVLKAFDGSGKEIWSYNVGNGELAGPFV
ncbi:hypothetical protein EG827_11880, partial [bacterium]|nr:hypothetical protein [bacterium]